MTKTPLKAGDVVHALVSGFTFPGSLELTGGRVTRRGEDITITDDMLEAAKDRRGASFWDLVDDPDGQVARWGHEVFRRGSAPDDMETWTPGSPEHQLARERARQDAWTLPDPRERAAALQEVQRRYGALPDETVILTRGGA